ncbi:MAG: hypothetical protein QQN63_08750 [Nitrosopumilus sp.]
MTKVEGRILHAGLGNARAWSLGQIINLASKEGNGEYADTGLIFIRLLKEMGWVLVEEFKIATKD